MAKLNKTFRGVPEGQIYPVEYQAGEECPAELEAGAIALGALGGDTGQKELLIAKLDEAGITYDKRWGVDKLQAALGAGKKD